MTISRRPVHAIVSIDSKNRERLLLHTIASTAAKAKQKWMKWEEAETALTDPNWSFQRRIKLGMLRYARIRITEDVE